MGKVPINDESLRRPKPTFSYLGGFFEMKGTLLICVSELKKAN
jgi:hypothetical protein